ncbi:MAG: molybdopterin molybdotransferase MoeA [Gammaproteobacteria bacterium]|nr:molybdopterin molybdotransferase MoeA [Gammaproteobacteria bacterium]
MKPNCDQMASTLISVTEAKKNILDNVTTIDGQEKLAIRQTLNRILDTDIKSTINVPPYDNSAMDGYAVSSIDLPEKDETELKIIGTSFAGRPFEGKMKPGETIRIMTGAVIPDGADTIIMQEHVQTTDRSIRISCGHNKGDHVRRIGEDMKIGDIVLKKGKLITPSELGLFASLGIVEVQVKRKCRVAFFSTGDELKSVGEPLEEGQIYDSNRYTLYGMLQRLNIELIDMGVIADDRDAVREAFKTASNIADAVITSGGVSVGEADYVKDTLEEMGKVNFWRVAMKPGKPLAIGKINNAAFFGVPGNPVSAMATFYQFVQPALQKMMGMNERFKLNIKVPCMTPLRKRPGRLEYQRGILSYTDNGEMIVNSTGVQGSHILTSMSLANCFIILPAENENVSSGDLVEVQPFDGLI